MVRTSLLISADTTAQLLPAAGLLTLLLILLVLITLVVLMILVRARHHRRLAEKPNGPRAAAARATGMDDHPSDTVDPWEEAGRRHREEGARRGSGEPGG